MSENLLSSDLCLICNIESEDMFHALFLCPRAKGVWSFCLHQSITSLDHDNLCTWLKDFSFNFGVGPIILWKIWYSRNKCTFVNIKHSIKEIGAQVFSLLHYVFKAFGSHNPIVFKRLGMSSLGFDLTLAQWLLM
jgi:hypothetical protein